LPRRSRSLYLDLPSAGRRWSSYGSGHRRGGRLRQVGYVLIAIVVLVVAGGVAQWFRGVPKQEVHATFAADVVAPGAAVPLPWPVTGQAAVAVAGIGQVGAAGGQTPVAIASLTKMMTAYQVLTDHPLAGSAEGPSLTVNAAAVTDYRQRAARQESVLAVRAGEHLSERQALQALLIASANNVAELLARWDGGSVPGFLARMNATAKRLGLTQTHYADPDGISPQTVSTATDQLTLAQFAMRLPVFAEIVAQPAATFPVTGRVFNYNYLVGHDGIIGIKTGSDAAAGGCWAFAARRVVAGKATNVFGVVLGQRDPKTGALLQPALDAGHRLANAVPRVIRTTELVPAGTVVGYLQAPWRAKVPLLTQQPVTMLAVPGQRYRAQVQLRAPGQNAVTAGTVVGQLEVGGISTPVAVAQDAPGPALRWRLTRI
jgi:D-alanyl-D-alanine carboxypeptidase (penicillin-binding protein 5/6)